MTYAGCYWSQHDSCLHPLGRSHTQLLCSRPPNQRHSHDRQHRHIGAGGAGGPGCHSNCYLHCQRDYFSCHQRTEQDFSIAGKTKHVHTSPSLLIIPPLLPSVHPDESESGTQCYLAYPTGTAFSHQHHTNHTGGGNGQQPGTCRCVNS